MPTIKEIVANNKGTADRPATNDIYRLHYADKTNPLNNVPVKIIKPEMKTGIDNPGVSSSVTVMTPDGQTHIVSVGNVRDTWNKTSLDKVGSSDLMNKEIPTGTAEKPAPTVIDKPAKVSKDVTFSGSRIMAEENISKINEITVKELNNVIGKNPDGKIYTGGAPGVDSMVMQEMINQGRADKLIIALPERISDQYGETQAIIKEAESKGAKVVEYAGGGSKNFSYGQNCANRNQWMVDNTKGTVAIGAQEKLTTGTNMTAKMTVKAGNPIKEITFDRIEKVATEKTVIPSKQSGIFDTVKKAALTNAKIAGLIIAAKACMSNGLSISEVISTVAYACGITTGTVASILADADIIYADDENPEFVQMIKDAQDKTDALKNTNSEGHGWLWKTSDVDYSSDSDDTDSSSGSGRGNPYHDAIGQFCSEDEAVTISW